MTPYRDLPRPSGCPSCGGQRRGLLEELADHAAAGISYRAAGRSRGLVHVRRAKNAEEPVSNADLRNYRAQSRLGRWITRMLRGLAERQGKYGTLEALLCARCGRVDCRVQDPQWIDWERIEAFKPMTPEMRAMRRRQNGCHNCGSKKLGLLRSLPDTVGAESSNVDQVLGVNEEGERVGRLEAIVCCDCGNVDLFVDAASTNFESLVGFSWLE